jgi:hypothetical protein
MSPLIPDSERGKSIEQRHARAKPVRSVKEILADVFTRNPETGGNHGTAKIDPLAVAAPPASLPERILAAFKRGREEAKSRRDRDEKDKTFTPAERERIAREMREHADYLERRSS